MKLKEFYRWYSNLSLTDRHKIINISWLLSGHEVTAVEIYKRLQELDEETRPYEIEREDLLIKAEEYKDILERYRNPE